MRDAAGEIVTNERAKRFKRIGVNRSAATWMPAALSAAVVDLG
jgi:hypothetical protein